MKVLDEKGRLFGKVNIVDLVVLLVVVAAVAVLATKLFGGGISEEPPQKVTYTVRVMEVTQETYDNVCQFVNRQAGVKDQLQAGGKLISDAYIVDVTATPHIATQVDEVGGDTLDLLFTIEAVSSDPVKNAVGTQEIRVGKPHVVKSQHIEFENGVIMTCQWEE